MNCNAESVSILIYIYAGLIKKPFMLFRPGKIALISILTAMILGLAGCGGDGSNVGNNTLGGVKLDNTPTILDGDSSIGLGRKGDPRVLDSENLGDVESYQAVVDGSGNVTAVWVQWDGAYQNLWSNRYTVGTGWGTAVKLEQDTGDVSSVKAVVDSVGNVTVVWVQEVSDFYVTPGDNTVSPPIPSDTIYVVRTDLKARRYVSGTGWLQTVGPAPLIETLDSSNLTAQQTESLADIGEVALVVDNSNVVTAVWSQHNATAYDLVARRYEAGAWGAVASLDADPGTVSAPSITVNGSDLLVLWHQHDGTRLNLWGAWYETGWQAAVTIDTENAGDVSEAKAVIDGAGNATVVWMQADATYWNLWAARYTGAWGGVAKIETQDLGSVIGHKVVVDSANNVTVVWAQSDSTVNNVWANRFTGAWSGAAEIEVEDDGNARVPEVVVDTANAVTAVWIQSNGTVENLWANRFAGAWGTAQKIESRDEGDVRAPVVSLDGANRVMVMWRQQGSTYFDLWSNLYSSGNWGDPQRVEELDTGSVTDVHMIIDGNDRAVAVWIQAYGSENHLLTNSFTVASGWDTPELAEAVGFDSGFSPKLLVDSVTDMVTAVWMQPKVVVTATSSTSFVDLFANRF